MGAGDLGPRYLTAYKSRRALLVRRAREDATALAIKRYASSAVALIGFRAQAAMIEDGWKTQVDGGIGRADGGLTAKAIRTIGRLLTKVTADVAFLGRHAPSTQAVAIVVAGLPKIAADADLWGRGCVA